MRLVVLVLATVVLVGCTLEPLRDRDATPTGDEGTARDDGGSTADLSSPDTAKPDTAKPDSTSDQAEDHADPGGPDVADVADAPVEVPAGEATDAPADAGGESLPDAGAEAADAGPEVPAWVCWPDCKGQMRLVAGGKFMMGCAAHDTACDAREKPAHEVDVPAFEIDVAEVTVAEFADCASCGDPVIVGPDGQGCNVMKAGHEDHPVNCVTWDQAYLFCESVGKRLCSEAEWELAARGTDGRIRPWGDEVPTCELAVFDETGAAPGCGAGGTMPVGSRPAGSSPCGAVDMLGNVKEWVEDAFHADYEGAPADGTPWGGEEGAAKVVRGGGFATASVSALRASAREQGMPDTRWVDVGFRCCRTP